MYAASTGTTPGGSLCTIRLKLNPGVPGSIEVVGSNCGGAGPISFIHLDDIFYYTNGGRTKRSEQGLRETRSLMMQMRAEMLALEERMMNIKASGNDASQELTQWATRVGAAMLAGFALMTLLSLASAVIVVRRAARSRLL